LHHAEWNFHFDYGVDVERINELLFLARSDGVTLKIAVTSAIPMATAVENGWISRSYGTKLPAKILKFHGTFTNHWQVVVYASCASDNGPV
jgi:hypothetical protein